MTEKKENQDHKLEQVVDSLIGRGIASKACVEQFFALIEAPPHAKGLAKVCNNLLRILPKVEIIARSNPQDIRALIANIPAWTLIIRTLSKTSDQGQTSLVGDYTGPHAFYVALWHVPTKPELVEKHSTLMAALCVAVAKLQVQENRGESYSSSHYNAALRSRKLAEPANEQDLRSMPSDAESLDEYLSALDKDNNGKGGLWNFLDYAVHEKAGIRRKSAGRNTKAALVFAEEPPDADDDSEIQTVQRVQLPLDEEKIERIRKTLTSPAEFSEGRETARITTKGALTAREDAFQSRKLSKSIAVQNQLLPFRWYVLSTYEVSSFLDTVHDLGKVPLIGKVPGPELAAFLSVMFWLSARPGSVCNFRLYKSPSKGASGNGYVAALGRPPRPYWVIAPPTPKGYANPPSRSFEAYDHERILYLPVPQPVQDIMSRYVASLTGHSSGKMFGREESVYRSAVNEAFAGSRKGRSRFTPAMLSDYVFERLMHAPGADIVTAMLATGREYYLGFVPLHYTSVAISSLQERYAEVCRTIMQANGAEGGWFHGVGFEPTAVGAGKKRTGSRYCPKSETVSNLVANLQRLLEEGRRGDLTDITALIRLHNRMVVYTTLMIGFATGYRSVVDPFLRKAVIDRLSGFTVISDKDDDSFSHSRIIWVPEMVLQQLDCYHRHLKALARQLLVANRHLHYAIRGSLIEAESQPVLFIIRKNMKKIPVHQKVLEDLYEYRLGTTIPSNANRHYLRTNLLEAGCPVDIIDAFMGHWVHGTSPWGRFSALSPEHYKECVKMYLLPILERNGWQVSPGLDFGHG